MRQRAQDWGPGGKLTMAKCETCTETSQGGKVVASTSVQSGEHDHTVCDRPSDPTPGVERKEQHYHRASILNGSCLASRSASRNILDQIFLQDQPAGLKCYFKRISGTLSPENILTCLRMSKEKPLL